MIEYDIYKKNDVYAAVRSNGFCCWWALGISMIKFPFSSVIYPACKKDWYIALCAFCLELSAFLLLIFFGENVKPIAIALILVSVFGISIFYYVIKRWLASKNAGDFVDKFHGNSPEDAINQAVKKSKELARSC